MIERKSTALSKLTATGMPWPVRIRTPIASHAEAAEVAGSGMPSDGADAIMISARASTTRTIMTGKADLRGFAFVHANDFNP